MTTTGERPLGRLSRLSRLGRLSIVGPWLVAVGLYLAILVIGIGSATGDALLDLRTLVFLLLVGSWGLVQASVGALIAFRRPENRIGRLLQVSGPLVVSVFLGFVIATIRTMRAGVDDPLGAAGGWWASTTFFVAIYLAFPLVGLLYPDGRLPGPRWRRPILIVTVVEISVAVLYGIAAGSLGPGLPDNPFGFVTLPPQVLVAAGVVGPVGLVIAIVSAVVAIALRWRRGSRVERSQLKWLLAALCGAAVLFPFSFAGSGDESPGIVLDLTVGGAFLIPIAIGIAILRYRLYEIDRLISRTVTWAFVTGVLVTVFTAVVVALQTVLADVTQGQTLAVAGSTLAAFALFQPVRRRVQGIVDRRFDRARYDAQRTVDTFGEQLRSEVDLARLRTTLITTTNAAVLPTASGLWLRATRGEG